MSDKPFLSALQNAEQCAGVFLFRGFITSSEAGTFFTLLNDESAFPWNKNPVVAGEWLTQHAFHFVRSRLKEKTMNDWPGLALLDQICQKIEQQMDGTISYVFCNRFCDPSHSIPWHTDKYGTHIFVLSLGSSRAVQFRNRRTKQVDTVEPAAGDMYFMPLHLNDTHENQVCAAAAPEDGTRLSFVFYFKPPAYADEYRIGLRDKAKGVFNSLVDRLPF